MTSLILFNNIVEQNPRPPILVGFARAIIMITHIMKVKFHDCNLHIILVETCHLENKSKIFET